jgi:hypothetical protein
MPVENYLREIINNDIAEEKLAKVVQFSFQLSYNYILIKKKNGLIEYLSKNETLKNLAWDLISSLFQRDEQNNYVVINKYFSDVGFTPKTIEGVHNQVLMLRFRTMVYQFINDELFKKYRETDGATSKIIRNIKSAINGLSFVNLETKGREKNVCFNVSERDVVLQPIIPEIVASRVISRLKLTKNVMTKDILTAIHSVLDSQIVYNPKIPIYSVAVIIKHVYHNINESSSDFDGESGLNKYELDSFVKRSLEFLESNYYGKYIDSGKVEESTWYAYMNTISNAITIEFHPDNRYKASYFDILSQYINALQKEDYASKHKSHIEYLGRLARNHFIELVKKDFVK